MLRTVLATLLMVAVALAGCAGSDGSSEQPGEGPGAQMQPPEPVMIHEDTELYEGYPATTWSFEVRPGGEGMLHAKLAPINSQVAQRTNGAYCFEYKFEGNKGTLGTSSCTGSNLALGTVSGESELAMQEFDGSFDGTVTITFSSNSQLARFVMDAEISYE